MIHAYPKRMWYVEDYLIPSMVAQGISKEQIKVHNDADGEGNLMACMHAFAEVDDDNHGTWHLQDDVCICKDFKMLTELYDNGLVAAFSTERYDGPGKIGGVKQENMWFSFPCIRIPNQYARECSEWVLKYIIGNPAYRGYWHDGVNDDWCFRAYLGNFHKEDVATNLAPNLVNHIDYLLGGGSGKIKREAPVMAQYWKDDDVVKALEKSINKRIKENN